MKKRSKAFTEEERAAMKEHAKEIGRDTGARREPDAVALGARAPARGPSPRNPQCTVIFNILSPGMIFSTTSMPEATLPKAV